MKDQSNHFYVVCDICLESGQILEILKVSTSYAIAREYLFSNYKEYYKATEIKEQFLKYPYFGEDSKFIITDNKHTLGVAMILTR